MQNLLMSTRTALIGRHEVSFWDDNTMELEEVTDTERVERVTLDELEQYRLLQLLLAKFAPQGGQHHD